MDLFYQMPNHLFVKILSDVPLKHRIKLRIVARKFSLPIIFENCRHLILDELFDPLETHPVEFRPGEFLVGFKFSLTFC